MNNKLLYFCALIFLCTGFYFLGAGINPISPLEFSGTARLMEDGSNVKIFTGNMKGGLGIEFVFTDSRNNIINTLSVENSNISGPTYRMVKGDKHDWLVVTTIGKNGTGYIEYLDSWYVVSGSYGETPEILSYISKIIENDTDIFKEATSEIVRTDSDDEVNIRITTKTCTNNDVCSISSETRKYVWQKNLGTNSGFYISS
jgi:hypothetical protein